MSEEIKMETKTTEEVEKESEAATILKKIQHEWVGTLENFIDLGRKILQQEKVIFMSESRYDGVSSKESSYRIFSKIPKIGAHEFHADASKNKDILLGMISNQESRQLVNIARRMGGERIVSQTALDELGDFRVISVELEDDTSSSL